MKSSFIVSLDFELFWGIHDKWTLEEYKKNLLGARKAIPLLLNVFKMHQIHATWATVGFLFAGNKNEIIKHLPPKSLLPSYHNKSLSPYCYLNEIKDNENEASCYYAKSLIKTISSYAGQEIASHTFSHYYCQEPGQTVAQFEADIMAAKSISMDEGYNISSIVFPKNQCNSKYISVLLKQGFSAYRDEENDWIHEKVHIRPLMRVLRLMDVYFPLTGQGGYIPQKEEGIWVLTGSRMYKPFLKPLFFLERLKIKRIKKQMLHAAKNNLCFHLWWHPHNIGTKTEYHLKQLEEIFSYYELLKKKYGMVSMNMQEAVEYFSKEI